MPAWYPVARGPASAQYPRAGSTRPGGVRPAAICSRFVRTTTGDTTGDTGSTGGTGSTGDGTGSTTNDSSTTIPLPYGGPPPREVFAVWV